MTSLNMDTNGTTMVRGRSAEKSGDCEKSCYARQDGT